MAGVLLILLPACASVDAKTEPSPTPRVMSLEEELAEEERAAEAIATTRAEKTQIASRVSPYVKISNEEETYLAFWFQWNDETVFLPLNEVRSSELELVSCQLEPETEILAGKLLSGWEVLQDTCTMDEGAVENASPIIRIPRYFNDGVKISSVSDEINWNNIDLQGEYAENLADVITLIVENDLLGSGDLTISIYRSDGPNGKQPGDAHVVPTFMLPAEALQIAFPSNRLENFEYAEDVTYALEREFTWNIPTGFNVLDLSPGSENWFVLKIKETIAGDAQEEHLGNIYIQVKGVGTP
jgi:hypothetical protein